MSNEVASFAAVLLGLVDGQSQCALNRYFAKKKGIKAQLEIMRAKLTF